MAEVTLLCAELEAAKQRETEAKAERIAAEEALAAALADHAKESGSTTVKLDGWKVSIKTGMNYKADLEALAGDKSIPFLDLPIKVKREFDSTKYEAMRKAGSPLAVIIARHVTATPAKVAVSVERI
jgi:hypothetical protein